MKKGLMVKNSASALLQKLIEVILAFVFRTILIKTLGNVYLGLSGLFSNIFSILSLAELGVSASVVFLMYEPLQKKDTEKLKSLLKLYSKYYNFLGTFILIVGLLIIPLLPKIIKEYDTLQINIIPLYIITLLYVVASYYLAYRRSLLEADQKAYINSLNYSLFFIIATIFKILALVIFKSYILTLIITLISNILANLDIYFKTNKIYSFLKEKNVKKLDKSLKKELVKRMYGSSLLQFGNIILTSTDNIIISTMLGVLIVGKYSNYILITNIIYNTFALIFTSITANIGNMKLNVSNEDALKNYNRIYLINFFMYFITCTVFGSMVNNLIYLWIGKQYEFSTIIVFAITMCLYIQGMRHTVVTFLNSSGLNYNTRYKSVVEVVVNIITSIILCKYFGIIGVILGTIISLLLVSSWFEPYILFKYWFKKGFPKYYMKYIACLLLTCLQIFILNKINSYFNCTNILIFIAVGILDIILSMLVFIAIFRKNEDFKYYTNIIKKIVKKIIKKEKNNG